MNKLQQPQLTHNRLNGNCRYPACQCLLLLIFLLVAISVTAEDWPMFRGNSALTGVATGSLPDKPSLLWTFKTTAPIRSSAAIVGNRAFVGSDDHNVYAIDMATGKKAWAFDAGSSVGSSPLVLNGRVFVGTQDGKLFALNASDGAKVWDYTTGDKILGGPNWFVMPPDILAPSDGERAGVRGISKTNVVVGSYDYMLHCLDAATGKTNWTFESQNYINGTPAISDGQTVFGGCDAVLRVIALADGKQVKEIQAGAYVAASAAVVDGKAYFGHYENEFLCFDLKKGERLWSYRDKNFPYFSSPAVTADRVIVGGRDKVLHCLKRDDGTSVWSFPTRGKVDSSPVVCGDKVVVGSDDGRVYIVRLKDGKEVWSYEIGRPVGCSPAVAGGKIVIGADDGNVYCFGAK